MQEDCLNQFHSDFPGTLARRGLWRSVKISDVKTEPFQHKSSVTSASATLSRRPTVFLTFSCTAGRWRPFGLRPNLVNSVQELSVRFRNVLQTSQNPSDHTLRRQVNTTVICNLILLIVVTALSRRGLRRNPDSIAPEKRRLRRDGWELSHGFNRLPVRSWLPILRAKTGKK